MSRSENRIINLPINQAYTHLLEFLKSSEIKKAIGGVKVVDGKEPSHIKVSANRLMGVVYLSTLNIDFTSQDEKTLILFNFDFSKLITYYILILISYLLLQTVYFYPRLGLVPSLGIVPVTSFLLILFMIFMYRYYTGKVNDVIDAFVLFFLRLEAKIEDDNAGRSSSAVR